MTSRKVASPEKNGPERRPEAIAAVLVLDSEGRVLLREETMNSGAKKWVVPGGHVEFGEKIEDAALREIREESSLEVALGNLILIHEAVYPEFGYHAIIFFYSGQVVSGTLSSESGAPMGFFSPEDALKLDLVMSARRVIGEFFRENGGRKS